MPGPLDNMPYAPFGGTPGSSLFGGSQGQPGVPGAAPGGLPPGITPEMLQAFMQAQAGKYQMSPEMMKHAAMTSQQGLETGQLDRSMKLADQLREDSQGQVKGMQAGKRFVAPGAASAISGLAQGLMGGYLGGDVYNRRKKMVGEGQENVQGILDALNK